MPAAGFGGVLTSDGLTSPEGASPCQCAKSNTSAFAIAAGWTLRTEPIRTYRTIQVYDKNVRLKA